MADTPQIRLYANTKRPGVCAAARCRAPIDWYRTVAGKGMPMNRGATPQTIGTDAAGREIGFFAAADTHWATCPAAARFTRKGPR